MKYSSTMTSKGTVTIPAELRAELGLHPGEQVTFERDLATDRIIIEKPISLAAVRAINRRRLAKRGLKPGLDANEAYAQAMMDTHDRS
jgi:AbrB family looped-hinge helix DNA binding protein